MVDNSIAAELLQQINLTKIRPTLNYLSPADALTLEEFEQSEYGSEYTLDVSNIEWGNASNDSHVFDIFSEFTTHRDSTKTRLDMLNFVASNNQRYKWDCHVFFSMHAIYLDTWLKKMSYWGTKTDELAVYALSDMLSIYSFVVTRHHPWTTVDASVKETSLEILHLCPVKLVFLGDNQYSRLWHNLQPAQRVSTYQTDLLPVFPDTQLLETDSAPPTLTELETAETLLTMHAAQATEVDQSDHTTSNAVLELQEPIVTTGSQATEFVIDRSIVPIENQHSVNLLDAMDKVVNHKDVSFAEPSNWLKFCDCMDLITGRVSELVETVNLANLFVTDQIEIASCRVELVWIKFTPTVKLPTLQTNKDLIALGEYFTRSKLKPKKHRKNRQPHNASTDIDYNEDTPSSGADKKPK